MHIFVCLTIWRYLEGAKPLQERKTPEVKTTYFMDYEKNKRTRSYLSEWEQSRSWLKDTDNGMVCTICRENGDPSTDMFITGCTSYKLVLENMRSLKVMESQLPLQK